MRLLLAAALALSLAVGFAIAEQQAHEVTFRVRVDVRRSGDAGVPDWDASSTTSVSPPQNWGEHWTDLPPEKVQICRRVQDEPSFRSVIIAACATRGASGYNFYYQTSTDRLLRNCNCSSYSGGMDGVNMGGEVGRLPSARCFATNATRSFADVAALFNQTGSKCRPSDFTDGDEARAKKAIT